MIEEPPVEEIVATLFGMKGTLQQQIYPQSARADRSLRSGKPLKRRDLRREVGHVEVKQSIGQMDAPMRYLWQSLAVCFIVFP